MSLLQEFGLLLVSLLATPLAASAHALRRCKQRHGHINITLYGAMLVAQHATVACGVLAASCAAGLFGEGSGWRPVGTALFILAYNLILAADATLAHVSGFRIQAALWRFVGAGATFARSAQWRVLFGTLCVAAVTSTGLGAVAAFAMPRGDAQYAAGWAVAACLFYALQNKLADELPIAFAFAWDNWIVARVRTAGARVRRSQQMPESTPENVPRLARSGAEHATPSNSAFPLLRTTQQFLGERVVHANFSGTPRPHVVVVYLESFSARHVGALGSVHGVTPNFDALSRQGALFRHFYANGMITSRAALAGLFGVLPHPTEVSTQASSTTPPLIGMSHIFKKQGYRTGYFHDGPTDWENGRAFFRAQGFDHVFTQETLIDAYPEAQTSAWNFDDQYLFRFHAEWLAKQEALGQPTFSTLFTISNHYPFQAPPHAPHPPRSDADSDLQSAYLRTTLYTDACLGDYMRQLRATGLDRKTVFVILGDHGISDAWLRGPRSDGGGVGNDDALHVPLLLLAPDCIEPTVIDTLGSQIDLLPTVLDLLGISAEHHAMGSSLLRQHDERCVVMCHPFKPNFMALRMGTLRYVYNLDAERTALFDLATDPEESRDLSAAHKAAGLALRDDLRHLHRWLKVMYEQNRFAPPAPADDSAWSGQDAPKTLPRTQAELDRLLNAIDASLDARDALVVQLLRIVVTMPLPGPQQLQIAQIVARSLHQDTQGALDDAEHKRTAAAFDLLRIHVEVKGAALGLESGVSATVRAARQRALRE